MIHILINNLEWIFDGIGTSIVSLILGLLVGGGVGYKIGIKKSINQKQSARDNANQIQIGDINNGDK